MNKTEEKYVVRRRIVLLFLSAIFISSMTMLNLLGTSRFLNLSFTFLGIEIPIILAVGVLPYPITFLCTDLISEIYGEKKASELVWTGLIVNIWLAAIIWLGGVAPSFTTNESSVNSNNAFMTIRYLSLSTITASMIAYFLAQYSDVKIFHFLKRITKGKYLWLRNNGSTIISQLIDTVCVICITHFLSKSIPLPADKTEFEGLFMLISYAYIFKFIIAILDTPVLYISVKYLKKFLKIENDNF
tara:strand:- start:2047 stop:2778 length:732 start_codon:yes stop_codon:yes gene_type:complete